jgi:hypothetical protein
LRVAVAALLQQIAVTHWIEEEGEGGIKGAGIEDVVLVVRATERKRRGERLASTLLSADPLFTLTDFNSCKHRIYRLPACRQSYVYV